MSEPTKERCPVCDTLMAHPAVCIGCGWERPPERDGAVVGGKWRLLNMLGRGGMGQVYVAESIADGSPAAVKFLLGHWAHIAEFRKRFRREYVVLSRLTHPGIVRVFDFGEHEGDLYLAMELVKGESFMNRLRRKSKPMTIERVVDLFIRVLDVLEAAHEAGIVHRDLKPDNVMLREDGGITVLDFGLAAIEDAEGGARLTASGTVQGTPQYMSPEQCRGQRVGPKTDVYSAGIMLFEALAWGLPFESESAAGFMSQHMFVEPRAIREVGVHRDVPPGLEAIVRHAIAKDANDRPTARQLREALEAVAAGTDEVTVAAHLAEQRAKAAALSREERAIAPPPVSERETRVARTGGGARVIVWSNDAPRARKLRDALAVNGFVPVVVASEDPPPVGEAAACILFADERVAERTHALRASARAARIFVAGAHTATQLAELVRVGANDVSLDTAGDDEVCRKVMRMVKRGR
jgi:serine/threonine-protein kinase